MEVVLTTLPLRVARSTRRRAHGVSQQPTAEGSRQRVGDLLRARMKEFGDLENLAVLDADFLAHARETARADFELRDADRVLVGHPSASCRAVSASRAARAVAALMLDLLQGREPRQEFSGVVCVLIVGEPLDRRQARPRAPRC